jgi:hypothetical protein
MRWMRSVTRRGGMTNANKNTFGEFQKKIGYHLKTRQAMNV